MGVVRVRLQMFLLLINIGPTLGQWLSVVSVVLALFPIVILMMLSPVFVRFFGADTATDWRKHYHVNNIIYL